MAIKVYRDRRTFAKYDSTHIIGFLNETEVKGYQPDGDDEVEPFDGYQYEGTLEDGATIMPCNDSTSRDQIINAIIRSKYSETQEFSIQRHHQNDPAGYAEEWTAYNDWCEYAKTTTDNWLSV